MALNYTLVDVIPNGRSGESIQNSEPSIAVDPLDPNQIIVGAYGASGSSYFESTDGGVTWSGYGNLPSEDKSLVWLPDGSAALTVSLTNTAISTYSGTTTDSNFGSAINVFSGNDLDQPWIRTGPSDHVYVAYNDLSKSGPDEGGSGNGGTASVLVSTDGGSTYTPVTLDRIGSPYQDDPSVRLAVNGSTVYAVFVRWNNQVESDANGERYDSQVVVVRSDDGGADGFTALGAGGNGMQVAAPIDVFTQTGGNELSVGEERIAAEAAIAVDPNNANHVLVAYENAPGADGAAVVQLVLAESDDGGETWSTKFTTSSPTRSAQPAISILADGAIGFLYDNYDPSTNELSQHFVTTTDDFATTSDTVLASESNATPSVQFQPYLGDFFDLTSLGNTFYGIFCASNADDGTDAQLANLALQRDFTGTMGTGSFQLTNASGNPIPFSIDPYFFSCTLGPPTIAGTVANQTTIAEAPVTPFSGVTIGDPNAGATDTLTIALSSTSGIFGTLSGTGLTGSGNSYQLSGTAAVITAELDALNFTAVDGVPDTSVTTTFVLSDQSSAFATPATDNTTSVIDTDLAIPPTIAGTVANQTTIAEAPVKPFSGVTITDPNAGATDTLTITLTSTGSKFGTLSGAGLTGSGSTYQLSGSAATITSQLDALSYTPVNGVPATSVTTTFTLSDQSSAFAAPTTNNITSVIDTDLAVPPTLLPEAPNSNLEEWLLANGQFAAGAAPGPIPGDYKVAAIGDFTGNGTDDILWQSPSSGDVAEWIMSNAAWDGTVDFGKAPAGLQIEGAGNFFGSNAPSGVLWLNPTTGETDIWQMSNGHWAATVDVGNLPGTGWQAAAIGDFTGDGTDDILWHNTNTGDVAESLIQNGQWAGSVDFGTEPAGLQIEGAGHFFGSNAPEDVLWLNPNTGQTLLWEMSNGHWAATVNVGTIPGTGWQVTGIGDFTGTGTDDILWHNTNTGDFAEWLVQNGQWAGSVDFGNVPGWNVAGIGHFVSGDNAANILWHANT